MSYHDLEYEEVDVSFMTKKRTKRSFRKNKIYIPIIKSINSTIKERNPPKNDILNPQQTYS